jgi:hypothetical protein
MDREAVAAGLIAIDMIGEPVDDAVVAVEGQNLRLKRGDFVRLDIDGATDDDLVAGLTGARRCAIEDAAARAALAQNDIGRDAGAGMLVPDFHELERQYSRLLAMIGIERDGAVIVDIGVRHVDTVKFGADNLAH